MPVEFNDTVFYKCENRDLFFEHDRIFDGFEAQCMDDGSFHVPETINDNEILRCVSSKTAKKES